MIWYYRLGLAIAFGALVLNLIGVTNFSKNVIIIDCITLLVLLHAEWEHSRNKKNKD